jgi:ATP-dependent helicase/nuclease subunit B
MKMRMQTASILRQNRSARIDAWLADGGVVLASSERAARSITAAYHDARQAEGRAAWHTPAIFAWDSWMQAEWEARETRGLLLLNPLQEKSLWLDAILKSGRTSWLANPGRLATSAQRAYQLLCGYAPASLKSSARSGWQSDAGEFSRWLDTFESRCRREGLLSRSRLALDLAEMLSGDEAVLPPMRPALLLVGFDRLLASQESLLDCWGQWTPLQLDAAGKTNRSFYESNDSAAEVRSCVAWLRERVRENPQSKLMVVVAGLEARRGELERELLAASDPEHPDFAIDFEFSMGVPLGQMSHARSALMLLQWLTSALSEAEVDWLLASGHIVASAGEERALAEAMRKIRRRGRERPSWHLSELLNDLPRASAASEEAPASVWAARLAATSVLLAEMPKRQSPLAWVEAARTLLEAAGWPGYHPLSSVAFQVCERWQRVLEDCGSLGFDDRAGSMEWDEFAAALADAVRETVFAAESRDAPVQITGPLESAGQVTDGIWFLGADENGWPGGGQSHPLLPIGLQRDSEMPHSSPQADWNLAQEATLRLLASAEEVVFSYARQSANAETRPSRLALRLLGDPIARPLAGPAQYRDRTESFSDTSRIPFPHDALRGGANILTSQSNCPFLAFATGRLEAETSEPAATGLNAKQRGILLHNLLHRVWAGVERGGISTHSELLMIPSLREFVAGHVWRTMRECFDATRKNALPDRFPARYLELESERLTRLVVEWLEYERKRVPFSVASTEVDTAVTVAGLSLKLRIDRIDLIARIDEVENPHGETMSLVIDYKSSEVGPKVWSGARPENVQLPLYATFALPEKPDSLEGLVIAQVRPANMKFDGRLRDANGTLRGDIGKTSGMVRDPLTDIQLDAWRKTIERLAEDFLAGRAEVDPREPGKTCEHCHLHAVCRIHENDLLDALAGESDSESTGDDLE